MLKPFLLVVVFVVVASACSSQPETCDEVADETIELAQDLIEKVESEIGEADVDAMNDLLAGEELASVDKYRDRATALSERAGELGCSQEQWQAAVVARTHRLEATTPVGELIIWAVENGGL